MKERGEMKTMNKKKKILLVTFSQGGPRVWAENLAKHLKNKGYEVEIMFGRKSYLIGQFGSYDIIHSCVSIPLVFAKKYILTIHGNYKEERHLARFFYPLSIKRADIVTVPSNFLKDNIGAEKALVIPNGIDLPEKTKESFSLINKNPIIGILTGFDFPQKATGVINLAKIIHSISPEIKFIIGGDGKFLEEYKNKVTAIHPNTEFLGHCQREDLFCQIDIFAYHSFLDNQPLTVLEAMAYGLPIISNLVGSIEEMLTGNLKNYIARTDEDYKKILEKLLDSEIERFENGKEAKKISQNFSWDKTIEKFVDIYRY